MPDPNNIVESIGKIDATSSKRVNAISGDPAETGETSQFSNLVNNPSAQIQAQHVVKQEEIVQRVSAPSPMEMIQQVDERQRQHEPTKTMEVLSTESRETLQKIVDARHTIESNPKIQFTKQQQIEGTRSLVHIDESLQIALAKVGGDKHITKPVLPTDLSSPAHKFLSYLTNSQYQLQHLGDQIDFINSTGKELTLGHMLALQMKMGIVTNQVEFFTGLLSKALESTKTIMNIQV